MKRAMAAPQPGRSKVIAVFLLIWCNWGLLISGVLLLSELREKALLTPLLQHLGSMNALEAMDPRVRHREPRYWQWKARQDIKSLGRGNAAGKLRGAVRGAAGSRGGRGRGGAARGVPSPAAGRPRRSAAAPAAVHRVPRGYPRHGGNALARRCLSYCEPAVPCYVILLFLLILLHVLQS